jgi:hypothetical protein
MSAEVSWRDLGNSKKDSTLRHFELSLKFCILGIFWANAIGCPPKRKTTKARYLNEN